MKIYGALSRRHWKIIFISLVVVGVSLWGLLRLDIQSALLDYFPSHSTMRVDTDYISDKFGGTTTFSAVVRADEGKSIIDPELLKSMDDLSLHLQEHHPEIGKIISFTDFIKRMNQIMNYPPATVEATSPETGTESGQGSDQGFGMDSFLTTIRAWPTNLLLRQRLPTTVSAASSTMRSRAGKQKRLPPRRIRTRQARIPRRNTTTIPTAPR